MAAASAFSYAQAAKGQGASKTQTAQTSEVDQQSPIPEAASEETIAAPASSVDDSDMHDTTPPSTVQEKTESDNISAVGSETRPESVSERTPENRQDDDGRRLDRPWRRNDKGTRSSSAATRSVDEHETRRPRKGKKGRSPEKSVGSASAEGATQEAKAEETPKVELSEAPIPSVNIWQQRKEAQQAKAKPTEPNIRSRVDAQAAKPLGASNGDGGNRAASHPVAANGGKASQKPGDGTKPERHASRGSRIANRDTKTEAPPSVNDALSWPTPETAINEEKKKPVEKPTRSEKEANDEAKPRQKTEWMTMEYTPSVSFETQMPVRGSKPRGGAKGAAGSRATPATAAQQSTEKAGATASTTKTSEPKERTRETQSNANDVSSAVTQAKRASVAEAPQPQARGDQKRPNATTAADKPKDVPSNQSSDHGPTHREGRTERGRGGYRGRGNHHGVHPHSQHGYQHHVMSAAAPPFSNQQQQFMGPRPQGPYSPPPGRGHNQMYPTSSQRGRGGRNNGSNYHRASMANGSARPPPVETHFASFGGYQAAPMSTMQYQQPPQYDPMLVAMVRNQIEYYFSIENLCKDMYLRRHMDSQGFVPLMFVTSFKRLQELATDPMLLRLSCEESLIVDYVVGEDDTERLRRHDGWQNFIMPLKHREEVARTPGPMQLTFKNRCYNSYAPQYGMPSQGMPSPQHFQQPHAYPESSHMTNGVNGAGNGQGASQLSATVPDFSPSQQVSDQSLAGSQPENANEPAQVPTATNGLTNGVHSQ